MCGIAGYRLSDADMETMDGAAIIEALGLAIEPRGHDATGVLTVTARGRVKLRKEAHQATRFFGRHSGIGANAKLALIHTRAATQGSELFNGNNHPIVSGNIVGVHNGIVDDYAFWKDYPDRKRQYQVDSEAIFAAIDHLGWKKGLEEMSGSMAVAWIDLSDPLSLNLAKGDNPICIIRSRQGSIFFASTADAVLAGAKAAGLAANKKDHVIELAEEDYIFADELGSDTQSKAWKNFGGWSSQFDWRKHSGYGTGATIVSSGRSILPSKPQPDPKELEPYVDAVTRLWDEQERKGELLSDKGRRVYTYTDKMDRITGTVFAWDDEIAWVEWDPCEMPIEDLDFLEEVESAEVIVQKGA